MLPELTKAVVLDEISIFRPGWNQTRAMDYFYYSGITNAKVSIIIYKYFKNVAYKEYIDKILKIQDSRH